MDFVRRLFKWCRSKTLVAEDRVIAVETWRRREVNGIKKWSGPPELGEGLRQGVGVTVPVFLA